jgi:hypothetical protein
MHTTSENPFVKSFQNLKFSNSFRITENYNFKIIQLRWYLIGIPVTLSKAKELLFITQDTLPNSQIEFVCSLSKEIYYLTYDTIAYIIFRNKTCSSLAIYNITMFSNLNGKTFKVLAENEFWQQNDFSELLLENYINYKAIRTIKKKCSKYLFRWVWAPLSKDNKFGIRPRLDTKKLGLTQL